MNDCPLFATLKVKASSYLNHASIQRLSFAYLFAKEAHKTQKRASKEAYITHPLAVTISLCELQQEEDTLIAGLLHDVLEDTTVTEQTISVQFGTQVTQLICGVTKLTKLNVHSREDAQVENYRRMFLAMAADYRVILIKLADRLHNMQTLHYLPIEKQHRIAQETLDIYAPLAHRLGISQFKWQLENLAFFYLQPEHYHEINEQLELSRSERESYLKSIVDTLTPLLTKAAIPASVTGRPKHIYSIFKKIDKKNTSINELYDLLGIRIVVNTHSQCYKALGIIHAQLKPISERFKDYIALEKPNGYQSLHTTVISPTGKPIEIQIRTKRMNHQAEFGLASHWQYKEGKKSPQTSKKLKWLNTLLDHQNETSGPHDFLNTLKLELYTEEVFVFTPTGDLKVLSRGSTALDFAYHIHTEIGHSCNGILVNGHLRSLNYELNNGDQVEILTSKTSQPSVEWLNFVHSRHTRYKIKQHLNTQHKEKLEKDGKKQLQATFYNAGLIFSDCLNRISIPCFCTHFHLQSVTDIYSCIAQGDIASTQVLRYVQHVIKLPKQPIHDIQSPAVASSIPTFTVASCCEPLPGEPIIGIMVPKKGIIAHRHSCSKITTNTKHPPNALINLQWPSSASDPPLYSCTLQIEGYNRPGVLQDILHSIHSDNILLRKINTHSHHDHTRVSASVGIDLHAVKDFYRLKRRLLSLDDIYSVSRIQVGVNS